MSSFGHWLTFCGRAFQGLEPANGRYRTPDARSPRTRTGHHRAKDALPLIIVLGIWQSLEASAHRGVTAIKVGFGMFGEHVFRLRDGTRLISRVEILAKERLAVAFSEDFVALANPARSSKTL